nr:PREDICTED: gastrokine-2 [Equus przewalskii]
MLKVCSFNHSNQARKGQNCTLEDENQIPSDVGHSAAAVFSKQAIETKHSEECELFKPEHLQRLQAENGPLVESSGTAWTQTLSLHVSTLNDYPIGNGSEWSVFQVLLPVVLAIFGTQSHGYEVYNIISQVNNGGSVQETVTIDSEKEVATINIHAGSCSSTTIFDYKHGYIASRLLSRRACYILKMNRQTTPSLEQLKQSIYETKALNNIFSNKYLWVKYNPLQSLITHMDWFLFGSPIKQLCKDVPLYKGEVAGEILNNVGAGSCAKAGLLGIFGISVCADIHI